MLHKHGDFKISLVSLRVPNPKTILDSRVTNRREHVSDRSGGSLLGNFVRSLAWQIIIPQCLRAQYSLETTSDKCSTCLLTTPRFHET